MPTIEKNGATLYYEVHGSGFPVLTFAPAGLQSTIDVWNGPMAPINPLRDFTSKYQVIVMDQRNAAGGRSRAPITAQDGWHTYTSDHLAVLDHLKVDKCHLYGQCIGGSFIMSLIKMAPERVASAVLAQPIGRVGDMKAGWPARFEEWARSLEGHPEATDDVLDAMYKNLYAPGFLYAVDREFVKQVKTPCLVLAGNDEAHPYPISEETDRLLPHSEFVTDWKTGEHVEPARKKVLDFFAKHTPAPARA